MNILHFFNVGLRSKLLWHPNGRCDMRWLQNMRWFIKFEIRLTSFEFSSGPSICLSGTKESAERILSVIWKIAMFKISIIIQNYYGFTTWNKIISLKWDDRRFLTNKNWVIIRRRVWANWLSPNQSYSFKIRMNFFGRSWLWYRFFELSTVDVKLLIL